MKKHQPFLTITLFALALFRPSAFCEEEIQSANVVGALSPAKQFTVLQTVTRSTALANGIEIRSGDAIMQITALRQDVLRVRVGAHGYLPEDACMGCPSRRAVAECVSFSR